MMRSYFWLSRFAVWLFAMMTVAPLGGCGYQFVGESSLLPKEARTIYVEPFVNRSRNVGLDKELTTALRGEFYRRGQLKIVESAEMKRFLLSQGAEPMLMDPPKFSPSTFFTPLPSSQCFASLIVTTGAPVARATPTTSPE